MKIKLIAIEKNDKLLNDYLELEDYRKDDVFTMFNEFGKYDMVGEPEYPIYVFKLEDGSLYRCDAFYEDNLNYDECSPGINICAFNKYLKNIDVDIEELKANNFTTLEAIVSDFLDE